MLSTHTDLVPTARVLCSIFTCTLLLLHLPLVQESPAFSNLSHIIPVDKIPSMAPSLLPLRELVHDVLHILHWTLLGPTI